MSKKKIVKNPRFNDDKSPKVRQRFLQYYKEKFFNKFLSKFEFTVLTEHQIAYIMRKFWGDGTVACFKRKITEDLCFAPWTVGGLYDNYDFPIDILLVNTRGVSFIPENALPLNVKGGACIGYIQKNRKSIYTTIEAKVEELVDIEMTIRTNLKAQKTPWLFGVSPENEYRMNQLWDNLDLDDPKLLVSLEDLSNAKALVSGATYNLDKLEALRQQVENEILTRLGINNVGIMQKKEHFTVDEVNSNNEEIAYSSDEFLECLKVFFKDINEYLGINVSVRLSEPIQENNENEEDNYNGD